MMNTGFAINPFAALIMAVVMAFSGFAGMGGDAVVADENNLPILNVDNQTNYDIIDKMVMLFPGGDGFRGVFLFMLPIR